MTVLRSRLFWQLALTITVLILSVEAIFLALSVDAKHEELLDIRAELNADAIRDVGQSFEELHPDTLNDADISKRVEAYGYRISFMVLGLTAIVVVGVLVVFHCIAMRPLAQLIDTIRQSRAPDLKRFSGRRPRNEVGELIDAREGQLDLIETYEKQLEAQVSDLRREIIQTEKLGILGELSAGVIHDLKNPLQLLMFHLDELGEGLKDNPDNDELLEGVSTSIYATHKIQALTERMTSFVRRSSEETQCVRISGPIQGAIDVLGAKLAKARIKPIVDIPEDIDVHIRW
ncbi:MAG: hypothetical protein U5O39_10700 [Gammaproteobacteria bacterium]|nr:hypothetical protein [Gammaproteobacteria bacterium]